MAEHEELTRQEKLALIKKNLAEVLNPEIIDDIVLKQDRPLVVYWGTATTGRPHCGYFVPMLKLGELLRAGCRVKVLLADIHAFLDALKAPIDLVNHRAEYYRFAITALLKAVHVPTERLEFVLGSSYQLSPKYTMDLFKMTSIVSEHDSKKAGAEVVKQEKDAKLSGLIYPLMQSLDEEHLGVDAQFGGVDQRKIFTLAMETLPKLGMKTRAHLMNPMVPGLHGGKMSASDPDSKIDLLDPPDIVQKKLRKAYAEPKVIDGNGLISFIEFVLLPAGVLRHNEPRFEIQMPNGAEPRVYSDIKNLQEDYQNDIITPQFLKPAVVTALNELLKPIQEIFQSSSEWQKTEKLAYPPVEIKKKEKKQKDKGNRYPGGVKAEPSQSANAAVEGVEQLNLDSKSVGR